MLNKAKLIHLVYTNLPKPWGIGTKYKTCTSAYNIGCGIGKAKEMNQTIELLYVPKVNECQQSLLEQVVYKYKLVSCKIKELS